jgi:hypothetical protein
LLTDRALSSNAQAIMETIGVRRPRHNSRLCTARARHTTGRTASLVPSKHVSEIAAAREILRISNAMPGAPVGNIEKRRNTYQVIHVLSERSILQRGGWLILH